MIATTRYDHDGLLLNVTVDRDEDACTVERITAGRDTQDIGHLFSKAALASIAECVDAQLSREARAHNAEARAERHQWHREFAIA
jgi:hypothetical protein